MEFVIWIFFGAGFIVMVVMMVFVFRSIWEGKKEREIWKGMDGKSSLFRR
jgi:hypothetical protein